MANAANKAVRLDQAAPEGQKQQEEKPDRKSDSPRQGTHRLGRFFAVGDQIVEGGAEAKDDNQEDQDDDDFQGSSWGLEKGPWGSAQDRIRCEIIDLFPRLSVWSWS